MFLIFEGQCFGLMIIGLHVTILRTATENPDFDCLTGGLACLITSSAANTQSASQRAKHSLKQTAHSNLSNLHFTFYFTYILLNSRYTATNKCNQNVTRQSGH